MHNLAVFYQKIKGKTVELFRSREILVPLIIILTAGASFGIGRLSVNIGENPPVEIMDLTAGTIVSGNLNETPGGNFIAPTGEGGKVVGSKNGNKYHFPWCSGALRISEQNKVWFDTADEARAAGYTPAANCKGLE
ncbi:MAG: hypothetical protein A3G59_02010 [Candidatus Taylorbacteria bacterium RIFCSPLOWO2_12_FULL_47_20]|uniref:Ada DNA repair metal-binding domain-containing protein n=2 Tax=Candidatus Tayloriibacteriota TaxID=1817919 RepID=A0A1G2P6Z2_9BACT|nr:MAG: hypothetical protein A3H68_02580 [Candidatus Taylorbacteria bacterium RIFCSPLOWO2_02_FULL_46_40]OHA44115.1 MAG: hypothetical protein A3G59_02010 [Candidatus Taylorbacteria bacterium RIFCSPLOWO2_12_FULL_47_20]